MYECSFLIHVTSIINESVANIGSHNTVKLQDYYYLCTGLPEFWFKLTFLLK